MSTYAAPRTGFIEPSAPAGPDPVAIEQIEIQIWDDIYSAASPDDRSRAGIDLVRIGSVSAYVVAQADILALNRALGLGLSEPARSDELDRIVEMYRAAGVRRFFLPVHPTAAIAQPASWLETRGFRSYNQWMKLYRPAGNIPATATDVRIETVDRRYATDISRILCRCFGWPEFLEPWISRFVGRPGWKHYAAFERDQPVAVAALFVSGSYGYLGPAATLPEYRGRGIQGAFIARRIADATGAGCRWLVSETAEDRPEKPSPSFRNMIRSGFQVAYARPNYVYEFS